MEQKLVSVVEDGYFLSPIHIVRDQLNPSAWITASNQYDILPPTVLPGKRYKLMGNDGQGPLWWQEEDIPLPPVPVIPIEEARAIKLDDLRVMFRINKFVGGVKIGANWHRSDSNSRSELLALLQLTAIPKGLKHETWDGVSIDMTDTVAKQILQAIANNDAMCTFNFNSHRKALLQSANPGDYDISTGWPESFDF